MSSNTFKGHNSDFVNVNMSLQSSTKNDGTERVLVFVKSYDYNKFYCSVQVLLHMKVGASVFYQMRRIHSCSLTLFYLIVIDVFCFQQLVQ